MDGEEGIELAEGEEKALALGGELLAAPDKGTAHGVPLELANVAAAAELQAEGVELRAVEDDAVILILIVLLVVLVVLVLVLLAVGGCIGRKVLLVAHFLAAARARALLLGEEPGGDAGEVEGVGAAELDLTGRLQVNHLVADRALACLKRRRRHDCCLCGGTYQ